MDSKTQCSSCSAETDGFLLVGTSCTCSVEKLAIVNATENLDMPEINFYKPELRATHKPIYCIETGLKPKYFCKYCKKGGPKQWCLGLFFPILKHKTLSERATKTHSAARQKKCIFCYTEKQEFPTQQACKYCYSSNADINHNFPKTKNSEKQTRRHYRYRQPNVRQRPSRCLDKILLSKYINTYVDIYNDSLNIKTERSKLFNKKSKTAFTLSNKDKHKKAHKYRKQVRQNARNKKEKLKPEFYTVYEENY